MRLRRRKEATVNSARRRTTQTNAGAPVFSYYNNGQRRQQSSGAQSTRPHMSSDNRGNTIKSRGGGIRFEFRHIPTYIALAMLGAAFLYVLTLSSSPRIVLEQHPGVVQRDASIYTREVTDIWQKSVLNRMKLTAHTGGTRQDILNEYHELADVRVQLPLVGRRPTIVLVPAAPALQLRAQNGIFYLDANGKALADTSYVTSSSEVPTLSDDSVLSVEPGKQVLAQSQSSYILQLFAQLKAANVPIQSLTLSASAVNQVDLRTSDHAYYVKFQIGESSEVRQAVGSYLATRKKLEGSAVTPAEYMDARVSEKVFYK